MAEKLRSVGLDVGTTSTQLILSELTVENRASGFAVPAMEITDRTILYESPVYFTPLSDEYRVDGAAIRALVAAEYEKAGIDRSSVDTGAIIITGETSRKENAAAVLGELSGFAGDFVVATAGPDLESVLAATGAGATELSEQTGKTVLHMDIGGGTSNLALIEEGRIVRTGCLNVGGRLLKLDETGRVTYVSPVLDGLTEIRVGDTPGSQQLESLAQMLTRALEMAAGLRETTDLLKQLMTQEVDTPWTVPASGAVLSFSGGVADCIEKTYPLLEFGDLGPLLGQAIRKSRLCRGSFRLGKHTIRATVIGAGCHSARLSGSTVFLRNMTLPLQNLPVAVISRQEQESPRLPQLIAQRLAQLDAATAVLALPGYQAPDYGQLKVLAEHLLEGFGQRPVLVCLEGDMAKALGHCMCLRLPPDSCCLCMDRLQLTEGSYLDIGSPVGPALPVVIKTLILQSGDRKGCL